MMKFIKKALVMGIAAWIVDKWIERGSVRHGLEHYKRTLRRQSRRRDFICVHETFGAD